MFGGFGIPELLIVLLIVLVFFGAGKLPEIGSALGKGIQGFRNSMEGGDSGDKSSSDKDEGEAKTDALEESKGETIEGEVRETKSEKDKG
jgi:sec-independent protein translocase protein TatA